ncbi:endonuclease domain-containing protein [Micrococcus luteus]|uniref:endonuclease domain-containing protein n=1 Tax=Micrococcus luteus TaxID=1270 RepID=UPI0038796360
MVAPPPHDDAALSPVFPVAAGLQAGLTASQLRGPRFDAPHHGLRHTAGGQPSLADVVRALQRTNPGTAATHATAARLWGMWLPRQWERGPIHLARTRAEGGAPRRSGVVGHELHTQDPVLVRAGVRITTPAGTWAALAQLGLPLADVVAAGDSLLQRADGPAGRRHPGEHPRCTVRDLEAEVLRVRGRRGTRTLRAALPLLKDGADSRAETLLRLALTDAGVPEPEVNPLLMLSDGSTVRPDLVWREARVCVQYEGDHHRTDPQQWRRDIERDRRMQAEGWIVLRVAASVFTRRGLDALLRDLAAHLRLPLPA